MTFLTRLVLAATVLSQTAAFGPNSATVPALVDVALASEPSPGPSAAMTPVASPSPASPTPTAAPTASASPAPATPTPTPTANPYRYVIVPTPAPNAPTTTDPTAPQILEIALNERELDAPGPIKVRIRTNPPVSSVVARALGRDVPIPQREPGIFADEQRIPSVPFFYRNRIFTIEIVAATPDGRSISFVFPVSLK